MSSHLLFFLALLFLVREAAAQRSCQSRLRIIFPHLFRHCGCEYSPWSEWQHVPDSNTPATTIICSSGRAYTEKRTKTAIGHGCQTIEETQRVCVPDREERLALLLGLGARQTSQCLVRPSGRYSRALSTSAQSSHSQDPADIPDPSGVRRKRTPQCQATPIIPRGKTCRSITVNRGKRSAENTVRYENSKRDQRVDDKKDPIPFDQSEHGHRFRRQINKCQPKDEQYVLFVLDTSGSIGNTNFRRMKNTIADLTSLFCKPIKVGVLTFNHEFHLEFCFNCFRDDIVGRYHTAQAIRNIRYRDGWTHTGGAAKCVCEKLLKPACGLPYIDEMCVDVIFITDGQSNDPNREICNEVQCLHDHDLKVNTYSLGIANYNQQEVRCIQDSSNSFSVFEYQSFTDFQESVNEIISRLTDTSFTCAQTNGTLCG